MTILADMNAAQRAEFGAAVVAAGGDPVARLGVVQRSATGITSQFSLEALSASSATNDAAAAITALNQLVPASLRRFVNGGDTLNYIESGIRVDLRGIHAWSNTLILYPGVEYLLPEGSRVAAMSAGQTVMRSATPEEIAGAGQAGNPYGSRCLRITGGGFIDGQNLASIGLLAATVSDESEIDVKIIRCNYRRFSVTGTGTSGGNAIVLSDASQAQVGDTIEIPSDPRRFYTITAKSGSTVTVGSILLSNISEAGVTHRAAGLQANDAQITNINLLSKYNDIGVAFGHNRDRIQCTDVRVGGLFEFNMIGEVVIAGDIHHGNTTIMHNFEHEIVIVDGVGTSYKNLYLETMSDSQANGLTPPIGVAPVGVAALAGKPLINQIGGRVTFDFINYPTNPTSTGWRRMLWCGGDMTIGTIVMASVALAANPSVASDYALVEMRNTGTAFVTIDRVIGPTNFSVAGEALVCGLNGVVPLSYQASWAFKTAGGFARVGEGDYRIALNSGSSAYGLRRKGNSFDRVQMNPNGISMGNGAVAPVQVVGQRRPGWTAATGTGSRATFDVATATAGDVAARLKSLLDDLMTHGLIGG